MQKYSIIGTDGKEYGPVAADLVRTWIQEGRANSQTRIRAEGMSEWTSIGALPEFSNTTATPTRVAPPSSSSPSLKTNSMAMTGLVMGILAMTVGLCCCGLPFNILGLIFSAIGLNQIKNNPDLYEGRGLAIAGLVLSILSLLTIFGRLLLFGALSHFPNPGHVYRL